MFRLCRVGTYPALSLPLFKEATAKFCHDFEQKTLESLRSAPSSALSILKSYFKENSGTVEGLHEICGIVSSNFCLLERLPDFKHHLRLLSDHYLAAHSGLLSQTCQHVLTSLIRHDLVSAVWITALNCARLHSINNFKAIEKYIVPIYNQTLVEMSSWSLADVQKFSLEDNQRLCFSVEYLKEFAHNQIPMADNNAAIIEYLSKLPETSDGNNKGVIISMGQKKIYRELNLKGIKHLKEKKLFRYYVDVFIKPKTVIEVLGPVHTFSDTGILNSRTLLKLDFLRKKGYDVFAVKWDGRNRKDLNEAMEIITLGLKDSPA